MLDILQNDPSVEVVGLMTTFSGEEIEVSLHHVPFTFIEKQAEALKLPLFPVNISAGAPNEEYESAHREVMEEAYRKNGVTRVAFGDIFLEEIRKYRENLVASTSLKPVFPLWDKGSAEVVEHFLKRGYKALSVASRVDLPPEYAGKEIDRDFIEGLPVGIDVCGENGEFHSFVYDGPAFSRALEVTTGGSFVKDYNPTVDLKMNIAPLQWK